MWFNIAAVALSCATYASAATHVVHVGEGGLVYTPETTVASAYDTVIFNFHGNHTVTRSSFDLPCVKLSGSNGTFASGILSAGATFNVTVNDTSPIWIYCGVDKHCEAGMVAAINPPTSGNRTFEAFKAKAKAFNPANITTTVSATNTATSNPTTTTTSKGAAMLRYSTGLSAISAIVVVGVVGVVASAAL